MQEGVLVLYDDSTWAIYYGGDAEADAEADDAHEFARINITADASHRHRLIALSSFVSEGHTP